LDFYLSLGQVAHALEVCYDSHSAGYPKTLGSSELYEGSRLVVAVHKLASSWTLPIIMRESRQETRINLRLPPGADHFKLAFIPHVDGNLICFGDLNRDSSQKIRCVTVTLLSCDGCG
jgi:hypothetical protein